MKKEFLSLAKETQRDIIISNFLLAVFVVVSFNSLLSLMYLSEFVELFDFETLKLSVSNGYYTLNNIEIGIPIIFNVLIMLILWVLMVWDTTRSLNKPYVMLDENASFIQKVMHLFL